jgi:hypothetical protein
MSTESREVIWGGLIMGATMRAKEARKRAQALRGKQIARRPRLGRCA